jgi:uncharacterized protein
MALIVRHDSNLDILDLTRTPTGGLVGRAHVTRTGVFVYRNADGSLRRELRHPDDVFARESLDSMRMIPITVTHPKNDNGLVSAETAKALSVGFTGETVVPDGRFVDASVAINTTEGVTAVEQGGMKELSLGYTYEREEVAGEYDGQAYDYRQRNIRYNHLALVPSGRAGPEVCLNVATDGLEVVEFLEDINKNKNHSKRSAKMLTPVQISLDGGLSYEVPPEVSVAFGKQKIALDTAANEVSTLKGEVQKLTGERDTLQAQLKVAHDAASGPAIQKAVTDRLALERVAVDFLETEVAKTISTLSNLDLQKLVVKSKIPGISLDNADPVYVKACFDTVVNLGSGGDASTVATRATQTDLTKKTANDAADDRRKAMQDRMSKAYSEK